MAMLYGNFDINLGPFLAFLALVLAIWRVGARLYTTPYGYHHARRAMYSTSCPCLLDADWYL